MINILGMYGQPSIAVLTDKPNVLNNNLKLGTVLGQDVYLCLDEELYSAPILFNFWDIELDLHKINTIMNEQELRKYFKG